MGMFDKIRKQATKAVDQHGDKIAKGIDSATAAASKRTGGKHDAKLTKGSAAAKNALDRLDGRNDDIPDAKPGEQPGGKPSAPTSGPPGGAPRP